MIRSPVLLLVSLKQANLMLNVRGITMYSLSQILINLEPVLKEVVLVIPNSKVITNLQKNCIPCSIQFRFSQTESQTKSAKSINQEIDRQNDWVSRDMNHSAIWEETKKTEWKNWSTKSKNLCFRNIITETRLRTTFTLKKKSNFGDWGRVLAHSPDNNFAQLIFPEHSPS